MATSATIQRRISVEVSSQQINGTIDQGLLPVPLQVSYVLSNPSTASAQLVSIYILNKKN